MARRNVTVIVGRNCYPNGRTYIFLFFFQGFSRSCLCFRLLPVYLIYYYFFNFSRAPPEKSCSIIISLSRAARYPHVIIVNGIVIVIVIVFVIDAVIVIVVGVAVVIPKRGADRDERTATNFGRSRDDRRVIAQGGVCRGMSTEGRECVRIVFGCRSAGGRSSTRTKNDGTTMRDTDKEIHN